MAWFRLGKKGVVMKANACFHMSLVFICLGLTAAPLYAQTLTQGNYTYMVNDGKAIITGFNSSYSGALTVPGSLGGYPVTEILEYAFYECMGLTSVTLPAGVTSIGPMAFYNCGGLKTILVSAANPAYSSLNGVLFDKNLHRLVAYPGGKVGDYAIPDTVTDIAESAAIKCGGLTSVTIPASVTNIGWTAFADCKGLKAFTVSDANPAYSSVDGVLFDKGRLKLIQCPGGKSGSYAIPAGVTAISTGAFKGCHNLTDVTIPSGITSLYGWTFYECSSLKDITIPLGVSSIGYKVFSECRSLTNITLSASVISVDATAFEKCGSLKAITVSADNPAYSAVDGVLFSKNRRTLVLCPAGRAGNYAVSDTVTNIAYNAFYGCSNLTGVTIGNAVTAIGDVAFSECAGLKHVIIPDHVTDIGVNAFGFCDRLTGVTVGRGVTNIGSYAFSYCKSLSGVYFRGDAPTAYTTVFDGDAHVTAYYLATTAGWGVTFYGMPTALWSGTNQLPLLTRRSPSANPAAVGEGASVAFSATADDSTDPGAATRGLVSLTWFVDGVPKLETKTGAPNAITGAFTFKTDAGTVQGVASRDVTVTAVALDKQGGTAETNWTVCVSNAPASQAITFRALPVTELGTTNFSPGATASSGLPVAYASANEAVALVTNGMLRIVGAGMAVITASQPGSFDFKAAPPVKQTLTVKARLSILIPSGGGTATGAGLYAPGALVTLIAKPAVSNTFTHWEDASQASTRRLVMPNANVTASAFFRPTAEIAAPVVGDPGPQQAMVGVAYSLPLSILSESLPTVTVTGLPAGLAYDAATKSLTGVPAEAVSNRFVTVTAKNVNRVPPSATFVMTVSPLPAWAQGTFDGTATLRFYNPQTTTWDYYPGIASMSVTAKGVITGKCSGGGTNYTFSAPSYVPTGTGFDELRFKTEAKSGKAALPMDFSISSKGPFDLATQAFISLAVGENTSTNTQGEVYLWRNIWKDGGMLAILTNYFTGYYTATLPCEGRCGSGYLTFTVDKAGGIKAGGKLADGTALSLSGTLIVSMQSISTVFYTAPAAYKGGQFFGIVKFLKPSGSLPVLLQAESASSIVWENRNPQATAEYGAGFALALGLNGGRYDTVGNLRDYYLSKTLEVSTYDDDLMPSPKLFVGTNSFNSVRWNPDGIALTVTTNRLGVMTGLAAPPAGTPVDPDRDHVWDYSATNSVGLKIALTRPTGIFSGTFNAWYDYGATHTSKSIAFEGVLTPDRVDKADGVEGRGFFLSADKALYPAPPQGKLVPYGFNWSYDFVLFAAP